VALLGKCFLNPFSRCKYLLLATERCIAGNMFLRATGWMTVGLVVLGTGLFVTTKEKYPLLSEI
jgi:hypothetical protein